MRLGLGGRISLQTKTLNKTPALADKCVNVITPMLIDILSTSLLVTPFPVFQLKSEVLNVVAWGILIILSHVLFAASLRHSDGAALAPGPLGSLLHQTGLFVALFCLTHFHLVKSLKATPLPHLDHPWSIATRVFEVVKRSRFVHIGSGRRCHL